jgi:hypothetical protein
MAELGGAVSYIYWSTRRTDRFLQDNGIEIASVSNSVTTPAASFMPTLSRTTTRQRNTRAKIANLIEASLGQTAVTDLGAPAPIRYAKGSGSIAFGEFVTWKPRNPARQPAVMFATSDYSDTDKNSVGVCLFGSMDNFTEYIQKAGPGFDDGWVSSSAPYLFDFIRSRGQKIRNESSKGEMALDALQIADGQGLSPRYTSDYTALGNDRPWQRAFTYGDVQDVAQWLAEIYLDVDITDVPETGHDRYNGICRVLVGAPLWIRTPEPAAMRLYGERSLEKMSADGHGSRRWLARRKR